MVNLCTFTEKSYGDRDEDQLDGPWKKTCTEVAQAIESGLKKILTDFSYIEAQHYVTFSCTTCDCDNQGHPASRTAAIQ